MVAPWIQTSPNASLEAKAPRKSATQKLDRRTEKNNKISTKQDRDVSSVLSGSTILFEGLGSLLPLSNT
jgi:hypothetical protein